MQTWAIPTTWGPPEKWIGFEGGAVEFVEVETPKKPWWRRIFQWLK